MVRYVTWRYVIVWYYMIRVVRLFYSMWCCGVICYVRYVTPCTLYYAYCTMFAILYHVMLWYDMLRGVMVCYAYYNMYKWRRSDLLWYVTLSYGVWCCGMLCGVCCGVMLYDMICSVMLCYSMLAYVMLCYAMTWYARPCYDTLCYVMLCMLCMFCMFCMFCVRYACYVCYVRYVCYVWYVCYVCTGSLVTLCCVSLLCILYYAY